MTTRHFNIQSGHCSVTNDICIEQFRSFTKLSLHKIRWRNILISYYLCIIPFPYWYSCNFQYFERIFEIGQGKNIGQSYCLLFSSAFSAVKKHVHLFRSKKVNIKKKDLHIFRFFKCQHTISCIYMQNHYRISHKFILMNKDYF